MKLKVKAHRGTKEPSKVFALFWRVAVVAVVVSTAAVAVLA
jgi:hypothetical protein